MNKKYYAYASVALASIILWVVEIEEELKKELEQFKAAKNPTLTFEIPMPLDADKMSVLNKIPIISSVTKTRENFIGRPLGVVMEEFSRHWHGVKISLIALED